MPRLAKLPATSPSVNARAVAMHGLTTPNAKRVPPVPLLNHVEDIRAATRR